jgi:hypothetical protein
VNFRQTHDNLGKPFEYFVADYFRSQGLEENKDFGFNPASGTDDPKRADYDLWLHSFLLECQMDYYSKKSKRFAIERKKLETSKADYWIQGFYWAGKAYALALEDYEMKILFSRYAYTYRRMGQWEDTYGVLVPLTELKFIGQPLASFTKQLTQQYEV